MRHRSSTIGVLLLILGIAGCGEDAAPKQAQNAPDHQAAPAAATADSTSGKPDAGRATATSKDVASNEAKPNEAASTDTAKPAEPPVAATKPADASASEAADKETGFPVAADPMDWPNWRGPEQNGISHETGLIDHWDPDPKKLTNVLWVNNEAGGISSPIIMRGKVYMINRYKPGTREDCEQVICLDAATGKELWHNRHNMFLSDVPAERIGWASCVGDPATGRVYSFGTNDLVQCLDGDTGKEIWSHSLQEEFGGISVFGGRTNVPAIYGDLLLVSCVTVGWGDQSLPAHRFFGMDKNTGEIRWLNGTTPLPEDTTFSTPFFTVLENQPEMIFGSSDGNIWSFQPRTGQPIWRYKMSRRGESISPLVVGDAVYMAQDEENLDNRTQGMLTKFRAIGRGDITKDPDATIWKMRGVMAGKSSPVLVDGRIYQPDDRNKLYVVDAKTGKSVTERPVKLTGEIIRGSPLYADGKIYLCSTIAWHVFRPTANGLKLVDMMRLPGEDEVSASVVVSHGRLYLATNARLYCLGKKDQKPAMSGSIQPQPAEPPVADDTKPAEVQVVPAEALVQSGGEQQFHVRLFNSRGQYLHDAPTATFTLTGPGHAGQIDDKGLYKADNDSKHTATIVAVKVGTIEGHARIRVVPPLPWKFDFQKTPIVDHPKGGKYGEPPITWVGAAHRNIIRDIDGRKVMVKITTIPKGTRSQSWMGPINLHDYTVQADVRGSGHGEDMPDIGLITQRYTLAMLGADQALQIRYWPPQVATQFSKTVPFKWDPNKWYTIKFRAELVEDKDAAGGQKAELKGKVWPRGEKEPDAWSVEATDTLPNVEGSPGLFGDATKAEIYYDNVQVYPNSDASKTAAR